jgi:hypothetical protein
MAMAQPAAAPSTTAATSTSRNADSAADVAAARRFCLQMMYRPGEAYFLDDPDSLEGALRAAPGSKQLSLPACAAAIEAMLAK